jgi:beta-carotene ketolase (CrtW type)
MSVKKEIGKKGILVASIILSLWCITMAFALTQSPAELGLWSAPLILLLTELYTGVFITSHDAIHGVVYPANKKLNRFIGILCASLFAFNSYDRMHANHHAHHRHTLEGGDPDFHPSRKFLPWLFSFMKQYVGWKQLLLMAVLFNLLMLKISVATLLLFWVLPMLISTVQLFYFGTYEPHRGEHDNRHKSGTQRKNHAWAFVSCYFFGYHYEHHDNPAVPWWRMYKTKAG